MTMKVGLLAAFTLADADHAQEEWGANCGPGAIAGMLGWTLEEVRPYMGVFETRKDRYTNIKLMYQVLTDIGVPWTLRKPAAWPEFGLARVQWHGPWTAPDAHWRARLRHSHWVGVFTDIAGGDVAVFDINAINHGGWVALATWETSLVPWLLKHAEPKADGAYSLTHAIELDLR